MTTALEQQRDSFQEIVNEKLCILIAQAQETQNDIDTGFGCVEVNLRKYAADVDYFAGKVAELQEKIMEGK